MDTRISLHMTELVRLSHILVCLTAFEKTPEQKAWVGKSLAMQLNLYSSLCTQSLQECIWLSAFQ